MSYGGLVNHLQPSSELKKMKKKLLSFFGALGATALAFADETGSTTASGIISTDDVAEIFEGAQTSMTALIESALPVVIAFVGGGLIIWGVMALIPVIKRAFGAGKGR